MFNLEAEKLRMILAKRLAHQVLIIGTVCSILKRHIALHGQKCIFLGLKSHFSFSLSSQEGVRGLCIATIGQLEVALALFHYLLLQEQERL